MRPTLSSIVQAKQLERDYQASRQILDQTRQQDLQGFRLLEHLSQRLPASVMIEKLEVRSPLGFWIRGSCMPGIRNPEIPMLLWSKQLQANGYTVKIRELVPDRSVKGLWRFELTATLGSLK